ncbi:hypothetical protein ACFX2I_036749 [Malus domestica]
MSAAEEIAEEDYGVGRAEVLSSRKSFQRYNEILCTVAVESADRGAPSVWINSTASRLTGYLSKSRSRRIFKSLLAEALEPEGRDVFLPRPQSQNQEVSSTLNAASTHFTHRPSSAVKAEEQKHFQRRRNKKSSPPPPPQPDSPTTGAPHQSKTTTISRASNPPNPSTPPPEASSSSPANGSPSVVHVFMVHGYGNDISWTFQATPIFLAQTGFACIALDLGARRLRRPPRLCPRRWPCGQRLRIILQFGQTAGPPISWTPLFFIRPVHGRGRFASSCTSPPRRRQKKWAIVPTADLIWKSVKVEGEEDRGGGESGEVPGKAEAGGGGGTAESDAVSRALYAAAKSEDKTLKIYEGMMHSLLFGEIDENVEVVRGDILGWLNHRCGGGGKRDE